MHNKLFFSADFEQKIFAPKLAKRFKKWAKFFCSKSAEFFILLCNVGIGSKLYEVKFFDVCCKKIELMKQIHL